MTQINKDTFFYYFLQETGGLYDPRQLNLMIEKLKEWLPESTEGDYKQFLIDKLK